MTRRRNHRIISRAPVVRSGLLPDRMVSRVVVSPSRPSLLGLIEDRRTWYPGPAYLRPALSIGPRAARRLVAKSSKNAALRNDISARIGFDVPKRVVVCVRRKQRKEVLHAKGVAGSRVSRRRRRSNWSDVDCT